MLSLGSHPNNRSKISYLCTTVLKKKSVSLLISILLFDRGNRIIFLNLYFQFKDVAHNLLHFFNTMMQSQTSRTPSIRIQVFLQFTGGEQKQVDIYNPYLQNKYYQSEDQSHELFQRTPLPYCPCDIHNKR